jgi:hypothetical protein
VVCFCICMRLEVCHAQHVMVVYKPGVSESQPGPASRSHLQRLLLKGPPAVADVEQGALPQPEAPGHLGGRREQAQTCSMCIAT